MGWARFISPEGALRANSLFLRTSRSSVDRNLRRHGAVLRRRRPRVHGLLGRLRGRLHASGVLHVLRDRLHHVGRVSIDGLRDDLRHRTGRLHGALDALLHAHLADRGDGDRREGELRERCRDVGVLRALRDAGDLILTDHRMRAEGGRAGRKDARDLFTGNAGASEEGGEARGDFRPSLSVLDPALHGRDGLTAVVVAGEGVEDDVALHALLLVLAGRVLARLLLLIRRHRRTPCWLF